MDAAIWCLKMKGVTRIGPRDEHLEEPHIVLPEGSACEIENQSGVVTLKPVPGNICMVGEREVTAPCRLAQGAVINLGGLHKFRFNHPEEAAVLRERRRTSEGGLMFNSTDLIMLRSDSRVAGAGCHENGDGSAPRQRLAEQQRYVECLREEIHLEQRRAERDLEREQACLRQQHSEIQQWILQEKQRLAAHNEKGTLESGVQTDSIFPVLNGSSCQMNVEEDRAETVPPSHLMGDRKRVVQEELLKHHSLRRAENRVRRKRLHYQLEKIARKRHLLEAKRELQRLENELLQGGDETSSPELGYTSKSRGLPLTLRRHSFSADLLSRLYPQHTPIFSQFLKRNRSSEFTSHTGFDCPTTWVSDECLQDQKIRRRSNTMPSRYDQGSSSWASSFSESLINSVNEARSAGVTETQSVLSKSLVKKNTSDQDKLCLDSNAKATRKVLPIIKQLGTQRHSVKGTKILSQSGSKGLENIRKVFSHSVGPGIRTALVKVFRKPPSGSRGGSGAKSLNKTSKFNEKSGKKQTVKNHIRSTMSYESLEQLSSLKQQQRHWHSAETLSTEKQWVGLQKETARWVEQSGVEDPNGSSDCDSIFSLDSLSSAYATALAEQLQLEEGDSSEAESEDSQMSQDSLVIESSGKHVTARPVLRLPNVPNFGKLPASCSSHSIRNTEEKEISKEVPAEVFWSLNGSPKLKRENDKDMAREHPHILCLVSESRPCSGTSRETENILALTDAWSSTDATESPRIKQDLHTTIESNSCQSSTSLDLSDNMNLSEELTSPHSDSTQGVNTVLEEQNDTSFENTLLLESHESSDPGFTMVQRSIEMLKDYNELTSIVEPCTTSTETNPDGVAYTNKPIAKSEPLKPTLTEALMINSCSKDVTSMSNLQCFPVSTCRKDLHYSVYPEHSSVKTNLNLRTSCQVLTCHNAGDPEVKSSKDEQGLVCETPSRMDPPSFNEENDGNDKTFQQGYEENDCFYPKQYNKMYCLRDIKDYALSIKQSENYDKDGNTFYRDNGHFGVLLGNESIIGTCQKNKDLCKASMGNMKLPKKCDVEVSDTESVQSNMDLEQSACLNVNKSAYSVISRKSVTKPLENLLTDQDLNEKEIKCAPLTSDAHKALISKGHSNISRNESNTFDCGWTLTHSASLNFNENKKEGKNNAVQITHLHNRYFQMSDSAIHDKISEVVKEHFNMSLIEDFGEDHNSKTNKENCSSAILDGPKSETSKNTFEYENIQTENPTGGTTVHLVNYDTQIKSRNSLSLGDHTVLVTKEKDAHSMERPSTEINFEQEGHKCGNISDKMQSEVYCAIESQSTDGANVSKSVFSCVTETPMVVNTSREKTVLSTQESKDCVDALNTAQKTDSVSKWVMEGSKVTVIEPQLPCRNAQVTQSLKQTNGLEKVQKADHQIAQVVNDKTKSGLAATEIHGHKFDNRPLMHGHSRLSNETLCSPGLNKILTLSTKSKIEVSPPSEATVKHTASAVHSEGSDCNRNALDKFQQVMEECAAILPSYSEVQNENVYICPYNTKSSMEHCHKTVDDDTPEARPLSKLAFYEFGPGNIGKHHSCVSQDKTGAKHALEKNTPGINSSHDKDRERPVEHKYQSSRFEDFRKDTTISDLGPHISSYTQRLKSRIVLKTCAAVKFDKEPQSENQSVMEMPTMFQNKDGCIKATQNCNDQLARNQEPPTPQKHQSTQMQKREPDKSMVKPSSPVEVYHKTPPVINTKEHYNYRCESTDKDRGEHPTEVDDTKHVDGNVNDDRQRGKPKRYRRAHFTAPPSSSTDSTPDLSLDESTTSKIHMSSKASHTKPGLQASGRQSAVAHDRDRNLSLHEHRTSSASASSQRSLEVQPGERHTQHPNTGMPRFEFGVTMGKEAENETIACRVEHCSTDKIQKTEVIETKDGKDTSNGSFKPILHVYVDDEVQPILHTRDSAMHFASSDINPFIHTRTAMGLNRAVHKNQAFGSATNISGQHLPLDSSKMNITRCCSVDNGLNNQNSPFSSHLRNYANLKGLSSTLSSVEDSRDQISSEPLPKEGSYSSSSSNKQTLSALRCYSCNSASVELTQSSGQVNDIVLVYSSEYESQEHGNPCQSKCDHGTQTTEVDKDLKRKSHHRRSSTQTPVSKRENGAPTTWASLQNMSEHISDLIHNTSDLLGNIQCMRTGERPPKYEHPKNYLKFSTVNSGCNNKKDCCTQSSMDIGIQTDNSSAAKSATAHEVNVIVKVIGSDFHNMSELGGNTNILSEQAFERIKSMPDLQSKGSKAADSPNSLISPPKVFSLETVALNQKSPKLEAFEVDSSCKKSSSSYLEAKEFLHIKREENQPYQSNVNLRNRCNKVTLMDRASSPILTVKAARYGQQIQAKTSQHLTYHETTVGQNLKEKQCSDLYKMPFKDHEMSNHENKVLHQENLSILHTQNTKISTGMSVSSITIENQSDLSCPNPNGSDEYSINSLSSSTKCMQNERKEHSQRVRDRVMIHSTTNCSPSQLQIPSSTIAAQTSPSSLDKVRQSQWESPDRFHLSNLNSQLNHSSTILEKYNRSSEYISKNWDNLNQRSLEDDAMSLVPSECNTDVLVSINPQTETNLLKEYQWIPDDLPMHNKFTNWSGIKQQPPSNPSKINNPFVQFFSGPSPNYRQPVESQSPSLICRLESFEEANSRTKEIERLRKEREQVMASLHLDLSPHRLTVELTEARLHYGQGETDTLLKMLKSGSKDEPSACTKQELLDRHRRSIESLRKDRDARLQASRRARSLSPSKHRIPVNHEKEQQSHRISDLPSRRREYLQQLRQEIVETSRVPDPPRREGQCPSDIELLLRDYSRAREEARAEIARARDRLRERTEQEKRRLQQQALTQAVKDDLQFRTRISSSTLCTGSDLSLSSGPTSGYNSSNTALLKDNTSPIIQVNGVSGFKVRTRPPVMPLQTSKAQRRWLSVQDVSLETSITGYEPESSSTPSSPPCTRQRTLSFGYSSSLSTSYQDIADCTLASAISEVYLASGGDVKNLLAGKASACWRHQGVERGIQVFHKATSRPTAHGFLGAVELERPMASLWYTVRDHSKTHLYHESVRSAWTRPLDESTQLVYLLTDTSNCQLKQPRDFCCLSTESKQDDMWVLAMQSVFEETLPRPSVDTVRGEMLPSAWILQPSQRNGREVVTVIYLLQVDLGTPSLALRLLNTVSRKQAAVIADLDSFFSL